MKLIDEKTLRNSIPFFQDIDANLIQALIPYMRQNTLKKGSIIFHEGEEGNQIFFVRSGVVCIYTSNNAKRITLAYLSNGEYFGEMALMQPGAYRSATAEALTPVKLYSLHRNDFQLLVEKDRNVPFLLLNYTMERLRKTNQQIYDLTFLSVQNRIIRRLLDLSKELSVSKPDGSYQFTIKITHQQLADSVGAARETVSKILIDLQEKGYIHFVNKKITLINPNELERLIIK